LLTKGVVFQYLKCTECTKRHIGLPKLLNMKKIILSLCLLCLTSFAFSQSEDNDNKGSSRASRKKDFVFENTVHVSRGDGTSIKYWITGRHFELIAALYGSYLFEVEPASIKANFNTEYGYMSKFLAFLQDKRVLDAGMGKSDFVHVLRTNGIDAHGIDINMPEALIHHGHYSECSINETNFPDQFFDVIFSTKSVLDYEYYNIPMMESSLRELLRILKPGGSIFFTVDYSKAEGEEPYFISKSGGLSFFPDDKNLEVKHKVIKKILPAEDADVIEIKKLQKTENTSLMTTITEEDVEKRIREVKAEAQRHRTIAVENIIENYVFGRSGLNMPVLELIDVFLDTFLEDISSGDLQKINYAMGILMSEEVLEFLSAHKLSVEPNYLNLYTNMILAVKDARSMRTWISYNPSLMKGLHNQRTEMIKTMRIYRFR
jgi:SAM-dependent methyltransferase